MHGDERKSDESGEKPQPVGGPLIPEGFGAGIGGQPVDEAREAMERLNQQARVLTEARMPKSYKITDEDNAAIIARFGDFIARHKITVAHVSRACDYSDTVLSEWQAGKYKGNRSAIAHAVNDWMEREARRRSAARPKDYIETTVAEFFRSVAVKADECTMMAA